MEKIVFYGTRGSFPVSTPKYMEFGCATTCIMFNLDGQHLMVDCGTGIHNALEDLKYVDELRLFISHGHMDHICGIATLLNAFKDKKLHIYGKTYRGRTVRDMLNNFLSQIWPIKIDEYKNVVFHEVKDNFTVGNIEVETMDSNHPSGCTLYKFISGNDMYVTAFDFCHLNDFDQKLIEFSRGATALIYDGTFSKEEFEDKKNWGHSTPEEGARIGLKAQVKETIITHYGDLSDDELRKWESDIRELHPNVSFARSGQRNELENVIKIGTLLGTEKDNDQLISKILETCMDMANADGGTIYLLEGNQLEFKLLINRSKNAHLIRKDIPLGMPPVSLDGKNICAAAVREKRLINIKDCYRDSMYDFSGAREYDRLNNYLTKSVIVVPMIDEYDDIVGVLQLINARDVHGDVIPFNKDFESLLFSITNQATISMVNSIYSQKINDLLYSFVKGACYNVGVSLSPYNREHTANMERFATKFLDFENENERRYAVDQKKKKEILLSILVHDIGKFAVPPEVMNKATRLGPKLLRDIKERFEQRRLILMLLLARGELRQEAYYELEAKRKEQLEFILKINEPIVLTPELKDELDVLYEKQYKDENGVMKNVITTEEYKSLSIVKGTLTPEERLIMEKHVVTTKEFLDQLNFPKYYDKIPEYACNHHEFLDGSGYPNHLTENDLSWPSRLITTLDIFEALTASDRPYKKPFTVEESFDILYEMCEQGKLDVKIVKEFENSKAWE